jgi:hypothetical protein
MDKKIQVRQAQRDGPAQDLGATAAHMIGHAIHLREQWDWNPQRDLAHRGWFSFHKSSFH